MSEPQQPRRVNWDQLRSGGVGIVDAAIAAQEVVTLTRRDTDLAVIVPAARYSRLIALARKGAAK